MESPITVQGYINVSGRDSKLMFHPKQGAYVEQIKPKVFAQALLSGKNVDLLIDHDKNRKIGSTKQGNLQLWEDNIGLFAKATITDPEIIKLAQTSKLKGWSFTFIAKEETWRTFTERAEKMKRRVVKSLDLVEVSILVNKQPSYFGTSIEARAFPLPLEIHLKELECIKIKNSIV